MIKFLMLFLVIIVLCWLVWGNFVEVGVMYNTFDINYPLDSPKILYENTKMNWFGCWFCFILIRILCPINTIIGIVLYMGDNVCHFIKWLFTVGREDDEE